MKTGIGNTVENQSRTAAESSIGHAIICDAIYLGLETTIKKYLEQLN